MTTAKQAKILVLDLVKVANPAASTVKQLRNLVCDGWLYGFEDGSNLSEGEMTKMIAYIEGVEKAQRRAAA